MPLIYITGISGSGKSSILKELLKRGYEAHGVDEEGFADWIDRTTGVTVPFPDDELNVGIHDWYKKHRWVISKERIGKLKEQAEKSTKLIFLAGMADGDVEVWPLFDKVMYLSIDEATMRHRIEHRSNSNFGKAPDEIADILKWLNDNDATYRSSGAAIIDATQPLQHVVDEILKHI